MKEIYESILFACMHNRAHTRHDSGEYVRGYLHRNRCV